MIAVSRQPCARRQRSVASSYGTSARVHAHDLRAREEALEEEHLGRTGLPRASAHRLKQAEAEIGSAGQLTAGSESGARLCRRFASRRPHTLRARWLPSMASSSRSRSRRAKLVTEDDEPLPGRRPVHDQVGRDHLRQRLGHCKSGPEGHPSRSRPSTPERTGRSSAWLARWRADRAVRRRVVLPDPTRLLAHGLASFSSRRGWCRQATVPVAVREGSRPFATGTWSFVRGRPLRGASAWSWAQATANGSKCYSRLNPGESMPRPTAPVKADLGKRVRLPRPLRKSGGEAKLSRDLSRALVGGAGGLGHALRASCRRTPFSSSALGRLALPLAWPSSASQLQHSVAPPDITNVQVQINTDAPGYSPLEAEQRVTFPVETAMAGLPLQETRSLSRYGLSQVTVVFEDGTDIYFARQLVNERHPGGRATSCPRASSPTMGPIATGLGEIFMWTVEPSRAPSPTARRTPDGPADDPGLDHAAPQLRNVARACRREQHRRLREAVPRHARPVKLVGYGLTFRDVIDALERNNANVGAGYIEHAGEQYLIRAPGPGGNIEDIEDIVVAAAGRPDSVRDVADVGSARSCARAPRPRTAKRWSSARSSC